MSSPAPSTSLERTYRYLRIGVAGTVVAIFVAVATAAASVGWLPSVSDYFYTPARNVLVGSLIAATLALVALSGRGVQRWLLDAAALFAPLIALVPTTVVPGSVPGVGETCEATCFPPVAEPDAENGVVTYLVVGGVVVVVALLLVALRQVAFRAVGASLAITVSVLVAVGATWTLAREAFLQHAHFAATIAFFALFAAVAMLSAFPRRGAPPAPVFRALYTAIAVGLVVVLVAYVVALPQAAEWGIPIVLVTEAAALTLFLMFWVVQGIENWRDPDPSLLPLR
jgi:hypothetical protein